MIRKFALVAGLVAFVASGIAVRNALGAAPSKCDSGITKAQGKKASCKAGVISKAQKKGEAPDSAKLTKCEEKFDKACLKAQGQGDCSVQSAAPGACAAAEAEVDACVADFSQSPSGAFLE